jgi:hypothetical protein
MAPFFLCAVFVACVPVIIAMVKWSERRGAALREEFLRGQRALYKYPDDIVMQCRFLESLEEVALPRDERMEVHVKAMDILSANFCQPAVQQSFLKYLVAGDHWNRTLGSAFDNQATYQSVLALLAIDSSPLVKQFVLAVARWRYSIDRENRALTSYDEQAMLNDMLAHSATPLMPAGNSAGSSTPALAR